jgi:hypothetical protein
MPRRRPRWWPRGVREERPARCPSRRAGCRWTGGPGRATLDHGPLPRPVPDSWTIVGRRPAGRGRAHRAPRVRRTAAIPDPHERATASMSRNTVRQGDAAPLGVSRRSISSVSTRRPPRHTSTGAPPRPAPADPMGLMPRIEHGRTLGRLDHENRTPVAHPGPRDGRPIGSPTGCRALERGSGAGTRPGRAGARVEVADQPFSRTPAPSSSTRCGGARCGPRRSS